jgi:uncharacterized protein (TIGR01777 family)
MEALARGFAQSQQGQATIAFIHGASGMGKTTLLRAFTQELRERGDAVVALTRDPARAGDLGAGVTLIAADLETPGPWQAALGGCDAVIHLAGESIGGRRWTSRVKQVIRDSRVEGTRGLVEALAGLPAEERPRVLVSASGADYYPFASGPSGFDDDDVTERDPPGDSFLSRLCRDWEAEAMAAEALGLRVVRMRTGLVFGPGGALAKMAGPFKFFAGGAIGSGKQWVSWIHRDDVVAAYLAAIDDPRWRGPINLVAPEAVRQKELARALGAVLHRPSLVPTPAFAVRLAIGSEFAEYLLEGRKVVPAALEALGFRFRHPALRGALEATLAPDRTSGRAGSSSAATP